MFKSGFYIKDEIVYKMIDLFVKNGEMNNDDFKVVRNQIIHDTSFGAGNDVDSIDDRFHKMFHLIVLPRVIVYEDDMDLLDEDMMLLEWQERYGLDYNSYSKENDLSFEEVFVLFSLCHEFGHIIQGQDDMATFGMLKTFDEDEALVEELDKFENDYTSDECFKLYRNIPSEIFADKVGVTLMKDYSKELAKLVKENTTYLNYAQLEVIEEDEETSFVAL